MTIANTTLANMSGDYFLSAANPLATVDQRDMEALAMRLLGLPEIQQAKQQAARKWKVIAGRDITSEAIARFEELIEEWTFNYVLKAVNSDANYPKVLGHIYAPPHEWLGMSVPGSRASGGDGPDAHYSMTPIDAFARFEIHGQCFEPRPADIPFTIIGNTGMSLSLNSLDWQDVEVKPDGSFIITIGPEPAAGRANHIQTKLGTMYFLTRDCRADWRQIPNAYRVKRIDPPTAPPITEAQLVARAIGNMIEDVPMLFWFMRIYAAMEPNVFSAPINSGSIGGLKSQTTSMARITLSDDEAYIITLGSGGAAFRDIVLHDYWFRTLDYWNRTSSMNNSQGIANPDGSTTYVISIEDPGIHNWLDPAGLHEVLVFTRWQRFLNEHGQEAAPWANGQCVKLADLRGALPETTPRVSPAERQQQRAERLASFRLRFADD